MSDAPTFSAKQVCAALDVPHGTLNSWAHFGYFKGFDASETTPGKARKFTLRDLVKLATIKTLLDFGLTSDRARGVASIAVRGMDARSPQKIRVLLYADNNEAVLLDEQESAAGAMLELSVYPQAIIDELKARLSAAEVATKGTARIRSGGG
jgi:DNA-binding transcriptional MerR regulator